MEETKQPTIAYYIHFCSEVLDQDVEISERDAELSAAFDSMLLEHYKGSAGSDLLFDYFIFQFEYWLELDTRRESGKIPLSWIVGKKAFNRWLERPYRDMTKAKGVMSKYDIRPIRTQIKPSQDVSEVKPWEELEKKRFFGTDDGIRNCFEATSLFNPNSSLCTECIHKDTCKNLLRKEYPLIYTQRGLEENESRTVRRRGRTISF